ncbi:Flp/Fap pilin component [Ferrovum sp. JA12]|jgi:pilus assembly protein Flp/PilA|uniref:Flp family type IVb pilin n=1 Tax=Ferrovum sp. JA12 TaxID=1356299 RepID=UPI000703860A|nr:Flp family type IVb pilin [Ferrovum sp. JA12]KRH78073.1 Flp/Fap pilin component [Ferrovum sp. JA12]HQT81185.1 Flp family type IVb pilin [Ferrovaceae bacterium]HQU05637.1 Flp family type IVb pilin [Ferrovaceae bacterium]
MEYFQCLMDELKSFIKQEQGVTAIEYGLIASLIGLAIIAGTTLLGSNLNAKFTTIATTIAAAI